MDITVVRAIGSVVVAPLVSSTIIRGSSQDVRATVRDDAGAVLRAAQIDWRSSDVGTAYVAALNSDGWNDTVRVFGTTRGMATITATVGGVSGSLPVTVVDGPPYRALRRVSGNSQTGSLGAPLANDNEVQLVRVQDGVATPIADVIVTWAAQSGGGSADPPSRATDANGRAATRWTLGSTLGQQSLRATVPPSLQPDPRDTLQAEFTATAVGSPPAARVAYALFDQLGIAQGGPRGGTWYNSMGGDITVRVPAVGVYEVAFSNQEPPSGASTSIHVTAYGAGAAFCKLDSWTPGTNRSLVATVRCFNRTTPVGAEFTIALTGSGSLPDRFGFASVDSRARVSAGNSFNSSASQSAPARSASVSTA
jgi:hypothetical protein